MVRYLAANATNKPVLHCEIFSYSLCCLCEEKMVIHNYRKQKKITNFVLVVQLENNVEAIIDISLFNVLNLIWILVEYFWLWLACNLKIIATELLIYIWTFVFWYRVVLFYVQKSWNNRSRGGDRFHGNNFERLCPIFIWEYGQMHKPWINEYLNFFILRLKPFWMKSNKMIFLNKPS